MSKFFNVDEDFNYEVPNWRHGDGSNLVKVDATYLHHLEWLAEETYSIAQECDSDDENNAPFSLGGILGEVFYEMRPRWNKSFRNYPQGDYGGRVWKNGQWLEIDAEQEATKDKNLAGSAGNAQVTAKKKRKVQ